MCLPRVCVPPLRFEHILFECFNLIQFWRWPTCDPLLDQVNDLRIASIFKASLEVKVCALYARRYDPHATNGLHLTECHSAYCTSPCGIVRTRASERSRLKDLRRFEFVYTMIVLQCYPPDTVLSIYRRSSQRVSHSFGLFVLFGLHFCTKSETAFLEYLQCIR